MTAALMLPPCEDLSVYTFIVLVAFMLLALRLPYLIEGLDLWNT
jgi:hypothetical protein